VISGIFIRVNLRLSSAAGGKKNNPQMHADKCGWFRGKVRNRLIDASQFFDLTGIPFLVRVMTQGF